MKLILASSSPRRRELLAQLPYTFEVIPSQCEENSTAESPKDICLELSCRKAMSVFATNKDSVVIGCDTVVDLNGEMMGKPRSEDDAVKMLIRLSGNTHLVHTGVCIVCSNGVWLFCESTEVTFRSLSQQETYDYVQGGSAMDKAGAYGIQDSGFVAHINGDYNNVMGFPLNKIEGILKKNILR